MQIDGTHALITGGASGLGLATARRLLAKGAVVFLVDLPSSDGAAVASELGANAHFLPGDVTDADQMAAAVAEASSGGPLRIVANCAGIAAPGKLVGKDGPISLTGYMRVIAINLGGTVNVSSQAAAVMQKIEPIDGERGIIINTASVAAFEGQIGQVAYSSSKGGVVALTLPLARELASSQIRVMTIAPGLFETPMMAGLPESVQAQLGDKTPHPRRLGRADEYAALFEHIVENPMLNGETIRLDGAVRLEPR
jgi:NAD(P)-dependent dehydrogenase (short-subunit alcohol dehydrogenase family)